MRKQKQTVTPLHPATTSQKGQLERGTLPWAHDMAGHAMAMTQQLETVARRLSGSTGAAPESEHTDLAQVMSLFAETLQQVLEIVDEVRIIMEDTDPSIPKAVNG